jgi:beta-N-acetylhexosaminidase
MFAIEFLRFSVIMTSKSPSQSVGTSHAPLIIDVASTTLTAADRHRLANPLVGGVIHFARNWQNRDQLVNLNAEIKAVREDLLICVDHEGGRVQRFKTDGFTHLPTMRVLGERWDGEGAGKGEAKVDGHGPLSAIRAATDCGFVLAAELRACGVDLSFAPVLDLDYGASSVIGDRAFGRDARVVSLLAQALAHGMLQAGMAHCGKHFPGHGFVKADSHTDIPVDRRSLKAIMADDAAPYQHLASVLTAVMPAHVIYPKVDARPAGFSKRWLGEILRGKLGFTGAVFSDDLSMAGARQLDGQALSYTQAAQEALNAGCDMVLLCNQSVDGGEAVDELIAGLTQAQASGQWLPNPLSESRRLSLLPQTLPLAWDNLMVDVRYMQALDGV